MKKKHEKKKNEIRYEEDLEYFVKLKDKYNSIFENYDKSYDNFVSKNKFDTEEKKTGIIKCKRTNEFLLYAKNNCNELIIILDALIKFSFFKPEDISTSIQIYLTTLNLTGLKIKKFNSRYDIIAALKKAVFESNFILITAFEWAIKSYVLSRGEKLKDRIKFINEAYPIFNQYYNLIINKEIVSDELIDEISKLMMNKNFTIPSDVIDDKDLVLALLKYTADFANYTEFHNLTVKKNRELQATKDFENAVNNYMKTPDSSKCEIDSKKRSVIDKETIIFENDESSLFNKEEVDNMVKSFLPGICAEDRCCVEDDMLPSKYDPNYNDIIIGLLKAYEEYTSNLERCTMKDFNKYNDLLIMVEQIKGKS